MKSTRRAFLRSTFFGTPAAAFCYGSVIEKQLIDLTRTDIPIPSRHSQLDGLSVAVMADFHHDDFGDDDLIARAVDRINREQVDLVMLAGDYISQDPVALSPLLAELRNLQPKLGSFAVFGNHDRWHGNANLSRLFEEAGITLLDNEIVEFPSFTVAGLDSFWGGQPDLPGVLHRASADKPILLGWHEPDTFSLYRDDRVILQMSGHTHGGQVCAPVYGPILLPRYGKRFPYGHYRRERSSLFVTRGIGTLTIPTRFLCAPEVAILTMRA